jgi:transcriptional regulator with XRE-family HTH domain
MATAARRAQWDVQLMSDDMAAKGWSKRDLAFHAKVSSPTPVRFLNGTSQSAGTAKKLAKALGKPLERYLIRASRQSEQVA